MPAENRPEEMAALSEQALATLADMQQGTPVAWGEDLQPVLRMWHYPAFAPYNAWMLFRQEGRRKRASEWHVREIVWDRPYDMSRFTQPLEGVRQGFGSPPTLRLRDATAPRAAVSDALRRLALLAIPVVGIAGPFGLDGDTSGIEAYGTFLNIRLEWWWEGPAEWSAFTKEVVRLREVLANSLA